MRNLLAISNEYSDCQSCGQVVKDSTLLVADPLNPGRFKSFCSLCNKKTSRLPYPPKEMRALFEMMIECAELNRPILVLVLACTVYETMLDGLVFRLLERRHTFSEICDAVLEATEYRSKVKLIESITRKKAKKLAKLAGFEGLNKSLDEIKRKRNGFLHAGVAHELDDEDMKQAIQFTNDTIQLFANLAFERKNFIQVHSRYIIYAS